MDKMNMTEEELNAAIERLQQKLTKNLQNIDRNFTECHQIVNSEIIPNLEKYKAQTSKIWESSKVWLYFFDSLNQNGGLDEGSSYKTNRPAFPSDSTMDSADRASWSDKIHHSVSMEDITEVGSLTRLRLSLQQPATATSQETGGPSHTAKSISTGSSTSSSFRRNLISSPPRTIPFGKPESSLAGTPIREASIIMTQNLLEANGVRSSDDDSLDFDPEGRKKKPRLDDNKPSSQPTHENAGKSWDDTNMMEVDDEESRARFNQFYMQRQPQGASQELPTWRSTERSPSTHSARFESPLAGTHQILQNMSDTEVGAYEFSDAMPQDRLEEYHARERQNNSGSDLTFLSGSNMTMISGSTGQIPAKFDLQYFPEKFRVPPASVKLTRVYNYFHDRPGIMSTVQDVHTQLSDVSVENIALLIHVLIRRKFLKKVGDRDAWTLRR
ncbi:DASH complex subunit Ask1-domain-containing protein [Mucor lusitanicus]|uniref:DASH complex subunit ASK1 n=1 Tax=Mucor circinelloides f. lusitanicus TaxID=29924 RepID=A0A8H4BI86_MUCCL|nr:DASH complex subunit Ask1-domain-containing protein [Mucor lusitanicus]